MSISNHYVSSNCIHGVSIGVCAICSGESTKKVDLINHPVHYNSGEATCECGRKIECIDITRHMNFNLGNAMKYLWRYAYKGGVTDIKKAAFYINDYLKNMTHDNQTS